MGVFLHPATPILLLIPQTLHRIHGLCPAGWRDGVMFRGIFIINSGCTLFILPHGQRKWTLIVWKEGFIDNKVRELSEIGQ